jgi:hypothetical protein
LLTAAIEALSSDAAALFQTLPRRLSRFALLEPAVPTPWRFPLRRLFLRFGAARAFRRQTVWWPCCGTGRQEIRPRPERTSTERTAKVSGPVEQANIFISRGKQGLSAARQSGGGVAEQVDTKPRQRPERTSAEQTAKVFGTVEQVSSFSTLRKHGLSVARLAVLRNRSTRTCVRVPGENECRTNG